MTLTDQQYLQKLKAAVDLRHCGEYHLAHELARKLITDRPEESSAWHTLGQINTELGEFAMALAAHQQAMKLLKQHGALASHQKQFQQTALGLAIALMRFGRFEEALGYWEAGRLDVSWAPWPGSQYWDGSSQDPDSLLVQFEGGYGDLFMFERWLPLLKTQFGFRKVGLVVYPTAYSMYSPGREVTGFDKVYQLNVDKIGFGEWKYSTSVMSMPAVFGVRKWADIPTTHVVWPTMQTYAKELSSKQFRLGFCWRAEENTSPVRTKSLPVEVATQIASTLAVDMSVFSLSPAKADIYSTTEFAQPLGTQMELHRMTDWKATADYLLSMDFVLTVDTAVAHLAGVLGVPCLVLLPMSSCWRWGLPGEPCHWYGPQLSLYRQPVPLEWNAEEIVKTLMEKINAK
jgi:hypothetical protein